MDIILIHYSYTVDSLHHNSSSGPTTITDRCDTVLADFQLVKEGGEDSGAGRTEGVTERDGAAERVDNCVFKPEDLGN